MVEKKKVEKPVIKSSSNRKKVTFKEWWTRTVKFFRDVKIEMKKVVWPSRKQVMKHTVVVLAFTLFFTVFILLADVIYEQLIFKLLLKIR
ncbi:preprotein translocase subunit SecE [Caldicellulosiruptor morganii]|uniref:Protein translocase subunit SecE n=1 Tax=Caldicellulosiruptor morganii TaxID=1387555 RepID=A0ABY7BPE7_9FIRM|nr:preprotein translocase subunit SecE [Caldicellulosiruptor morganii]WAM34698.1 preprotein translocase subunit SecE [Caldicellulosiruptor morganii]